VSAADETDDRPASPKQRAYIAGLTAERDVPPALRRRVTATNLTHADCVQLIPQLKALPRYVDLDEGEMMTPEGYDDSPDQGVHRYDGGGMW
jgi:hypothetical protein